MGEEEISSGCLAPHQLSTATQDIFCPCIRQRKDFLKLRNITHMCKLFKDKKSVKPPDQCRCFKGLVLNAGGTLIQMV